MKRGVLLVNLGSPDSPSVPHVRTYLREFLMDGRVIDAPWPIRFFVVYGLILPFRPRKSAEAYHQIWTPEGSPLIVMGQRVRDQLAARLDLPVALAMRYRNPSIPHAVVELQAQGVTDLFVVPLFPHYAMSSYETAVERTREVVQAQAPDLRLRFLAPYYDDADYLGALVASAENHLRREHDHLLFSFHGLPERHLRKADPTHAHCLATPDCCSVRSSALPTCYRAQCLRTVEGVARLANLARDRYSVAFQSRLGREPWLQPYTDAEIIRLAKAGKRRLLVMCPAFVADCLETLEEIGMRGRELFLENGGHEFTLVPCLNDHPEWINALQRMIGRFLETSAES